MVLADFTGEEADDADLEAPKIYEPIESFEQLDTKLNQYMSQYNETVRGGQMDLVFFKVAHQTSILTLQWTDLYSIITD